MSNQSSNEPAFPIHGVNADGSSGIAIYPGMTLRDYIAIHIAAAAVANPATTNPWSGDFLQRVSYEFADKMLMIRSKL